MLGEHHVGGFTADARQGREIILGARKFAVKLREHASAKPNEILGLSTVVIYGTYYRFYFGEIGVSHL